MKNSWKRRLSGIIPAECVLERLIDRVAFASDASLYTKTPQVVVQPSSIAEVQGLFGFSLEHRVPLTFRAAGTSLSGQALSSGMLVDISQHWGGIVVEEGGGKVRVQPGVVGQVVNTTLASHGVKMGPDPASISACMTGGILANNASGMCCGVKHNSYHTIDSLTFVLPDGTCIDTDEDDADDRFHRAAPQIAQGLLDLRARILDDEQLVARIRAKYETKNTTGYSLNAFIDFDTAVEIMAHLLIGSEGTLGFIAEAVFNTIPSLPHKYTGLLLFETVEQAAAAIVPLRDSGAVALELMDRASLRSVEDMEGVPAYIKEVPETAAALLVEYQCASEEELEAAVAQSATAFGALDLLREADFTRDPAQQAALWKIRKGLYPSVGAVRAAGSTVIIEDVAFPVDKLAAAVTDLQALFAKHGYENAIIFGHAKDGNLHFVITPRFGDAEEADRYRVFIDDLVEMVVKRYDGALKAEHGTGLNMAPFVQTEWGPEAYAIMQELKRLIDPHNLLNPGVIINDDPECHLAHIKQMPLVSETVDACMECGFCEPSCPSRRLTATPRRRIVVLRELRRRAAQGSPASELALLRKEFQYLGLDTCATDGLCGVACPVSIDTGALVKLMREEQTSRFGNWVAGLVADHFLPVEMLVPLLLRAGHLAQRAVGAGSLETLTRGLDRVAPFAVHKWTARMMRAAPFRLPRSTPADAAFVYYPSCISRTMGPADGVSRPSLPEVVIELAQRARVPLLLPKGVRGTCCGTPFSSKGYSEAYRRAVRRLVAKCWEWSAQGQRPIVVDTTPCTLRLRTCRDALLPEQRERYDRLQFLDSVEFAHDVLLPQLEVALLLERVVLHPVCSVSKMGLVEKLRAVAAACAENVHIPIHAGCCGVAGDRNLLHPELTAAATMEEAAEVRGGDFDGHFSSSLPCESGLSLAVGRQYLSILYLLERASRGA